MYIGPQPSLVPLTQEQLYAGDNRFARLDASNLGAFSLRNKLINGDFLFWQRGTTGGSGFGYLADRWMGINGNTHQMALDSPTAGSFRSIEIGQTGLNFPGIMQRLESITARHLAGKKATLSFWAKNMGGSAALGVELNYCNSPDNFGAVTPFFSKLMPAGPVGEWRFYSVTIDVPAQAANSFDVKIYRPNTSPSVTRYCEIQLEEGSVATPFERRPLGLERLLCMRYFQFYQCHRRFYAAAAQTDETGFMFPVPMRTTPTVVNISTGSTLNLAQHYLTADANNSGFFTVVSAAAGDCWVAKDLYTLDAEL